MQENNSSSKSNPSLFRVLAAAVLLSFTPMVIRAQPPPARATLRALTVDAAGKPVAGARVQLRRTEKSESYSSMAMTDEQGKADFANLVRGKYEAIVSKDGFETLRQSEITLTAGAAMEIRFTLVPKIEVRDSVNIRASAENPIEQGASPAAELRREQVKSLPSKPATVADTLPLVPGVTRTPDGEIRIEGSGEHRSALVVNATDVTDPATGQIGLTVPIDSVETVNVLKNPYLAQYGRFTTGVVAVETRRGGDKWNFELNDVLPDFRIRSLHLRGLKEFEPRINFNGPLIANKLFFSESLQYSLMKVPVRTLLFPFNETKTESFNSFTQLDYIISPTHTLTGTLHVAPHHANFVNLNFFNPQPVAPGFAGRDYRAAITTRRDFSGNLIESTLALQDSDTRVAGQGRAEMILTPAGNRGNYFSEQNRETARQEWLEQVTLKPLTRFGTHNVKLGATLAHTTTLGQFIARPVNILDAAGQLIKRIEFSGGRPYSRGDLEADFFAQDHWTIKPQLGVDFGVRVERQNLTGALRAAPRIGFAWTPFKDQRTTVRGGIGLFYDRVPLSVYAFARYPEQVITTYAPGGTILDGPRRFINLTDQAAASEFPFIHRSKKPGNFAPYSAAWNIEIEHAFNSHLRLRANYLQSNSSGLVIVTPQVVQGQDALVLGGGGKSRYRQLELTARVAWKDGNELLVSYVRSRASGDLSEFSRYLGNYPSAVVRPNQFSNLAGDLPHRFLAYGTLKLPFKMQLSPMVEYRSGFPYAPLDAARNFVGTPNTLRFPNFFSLDARVSKDFKISEKYSVRFSVSGYNLTNHFNALDVHANTADPQFGAFFGNYKRRFRMDFDIIF